MKERLQKLLSAGGICSRRRAEELINNGLVTVNGRKASIGDKADLRHDIIVADGQRLKHEPKKHVLRYIMLYKPRGYVTTMSDELGRRTAAELLKTVGTRVYPVGRLDKDSEGLLLFTNDGDFANQVSHPSAGIKKQYRVTVREQVTEEQLTELCTGVVIDGQKTAGCDVHTITKEPGRSVLLFVMSEGKNRQIRKMCEKIGLTVVRLKRIAIGPLKLGMLKPGEFRELKKEELIAFRNACAKTAKEQR